MSKPAKDTIAVLIVDDEPAARRGLRKLLEPYPEAEVAGECSNGLEALEAIPRLEPDLVFLDIQMPELDGFGVIRMIGPDKMPPIIFVTAFDSYALQAFEIHAIDYLLKPVDDDRFSRAYERAAAMIRRERTSELSERMSALLEHMERRNGARAADGGDERLFIKEAGRIFFLNMEDIIRLEAAGNYVIVHTKTGRHLHRETMSNMEKVLDRDSFVRVSRSVIINIDCMKELRPLAKGVYEIVLTDGAVVRSGRYYRANIDKMISKSQ